jgi:hypothetical protein
VIGAPEEIGDFLHGMRDGGPLRDRPKHFRRAEGWTVVLPLERMPGRNNEHRHVLRIGLRDASEGVLDAGPVLRGEHPDLASAADAREAVRDADAHPLLPAQDRADVELGAGVDERIARIAGKELGSLSLQDFGHHLRAIHYVCLSYVESDGVGFSTSAVRDRPGYSAAASISMRTLSLTISRRGASRGASKRAERTR